MLYCKNLFPAYVFIGIYIVLKKYPLGYIRQLTKYIRNPNQNNSDTGAKIC